MPNPKIDEYMPVFYRRFFQAVEGLSDDVSFKYFRVVCHYWDKRCVGILNDDEFMRNIARCEREQWGRVKPIIFGQFFQQEKGLWHQSFARDNYQKSLEISNRNRERTAAATAARKKHAT